MGGSVVIFLRSADWEARWLAVSAALAAASLGDEVQLALFGEPLRAFVAGTFDAGAPPEAVALGASGLASAISEARGVLPLKIVACDTAVRLAGLDAAAAVPPLDAVVGLTGLVRQAQGGRSLSF